ncbi:MAG TPA: hypothetical protein VLX92_26610 [Kofleriaceae bacterium]|nr:hypothetical protein [Kofleriaceae bacterium]
MTRLALALILVAGCLRSHGDDVCNQPGVAGKEPAQELRDPQTGICQPFSPGGGTCPCGEECPVEGIAEPDWGVCAGACDALDPTACVATSGCHEALIVDANSNMAPSFWGCWEVAPPGPVEGGSCTNLDAQTCQSHDDCISTYTRDSTGATSYTSCAAETAPAACSTLDETACKARSDCDPTYVGTNCTCDVHGCTCQTETFQSCQSL